MNRALMGLAPADQIDTASGPLRFAKPGEIARDLAKRTVPVHEALAALAERMPKGR